MLHEIAFNLAYKGLVNLRDIQEMDFGDVQAFNSRLVAQLKLESKNAGVLS